MLTVLKRLAVLAAVAALLLGLAPTAHATFFGVCSSSSDPSNPLGGAGDGLFLAGASDGGDISCSFTTTQTRSLSYAIQTGNAWNIKVNGTVVRSGPAVLPTTVVNGAFSVGAGQTVTLTILEACDPTGQECGAQATAAVGANN